MNDFQKEWTIWLGQETNPSVSNPQTDDELAVDPLVLPRAVYLHYPQDLSLRTSFGIFQEKKLMTVKEKYEDKENEGPWDGSQDMKGLKEERIIA